MRARRVLGAVAAAALFVAGGIAIGRQLQDDEPAPQRQLASTTTSLPTRAEASSPKAQVGASELLDGDASLVATFRGLYRPLLEVHPSTGDHEQKAICERVASDLKREVDPIKLVDAAAAVPDATLTELTFNARVTVAAALASCVEGDGEERNRQLGVLAGINAMFDRRMEEIS